MERNDSGGVVLSETETAPSLGERSQSVSSLQRICVETQMR